MLIFAHPKSTTDQKIAACGSSYGGTGQAPFIQVNGAFVRKKECFSTTPRHNARRAESI
jgi:hypothetical protein